MSEPGGASTGSVGGCSGDNVAFVAAAASVVAPVLAAAADDDDDENYNDSDY